MSNKAEKRGLVPKLRFPEFREAGEWEARTLDSLLDYQQPTAYLVSDTKYNDAYNTPVLTAGKTFILGYTNEQHGIFCKNLPVVIFDDFTTATQFVDFPFKAKSSAMKILQAKKGADIKFVYEAMQLISYEVGAHERHWISTFAPMPILAPTPDEQQKIADCLASLDELITLEAQQLDTLKTHKKGLMQQLFPAEGETLPKLRFPEFRDAGEWKAKRLEDFAVIVRGGSPRPIDEYITNDPSGLNWLKIGDINKESKYVTCTRDKVIPAALNKTRVVSPGDLILSNSMSFGRPYILEIETCIHDGWIAVSEIDKSLDRDYLYYLMMTSVSQTYFSNNAAGSGVQNLNADIIKLLPVSYPSNKEQQKIADCLASLDDLIAAQTQKLAALKTHKKGLMQQLLPALSEGPA